MSSKNHHEEPILCPVGRFFLEMERAAGKKSEFMGHLNRSRVEFLKAIRSLVDERIEDLEGKDRKRPEKKATKIKVE
jgi:hypothetical protein